MKFAVYLLLVACAQALVLPNLRALELVFQLPLAKDAVFEQPVAISAPVAQEATDGQTASFAQTHASVPHRYIVVLKDGFSENEYDAHHDWVDQQCLLMKRDVVHDTLAKAMDFVDNALNKIHIDSLRGYTGYLPPQMVDKIRRNPMVAFVEQDSVVHLSDVDVQNNAPWGLARISLRLLGTPEVSNYFYDLDGGAGVTAYVIDTGIKTTHPDFEGRAVWGDAVAFPKLKVDAHGHGSHVAGTIGSRTYGVAKNVDLVAVGVMNVLGSGTISDIIKGVEFAVNDHRLKLAANKKGYKGATVNMLIGGGSSQALDLAVNAAVKSGLHVAVAAGNENSDACEGSPARAGGPITVGATDNADRLAEFSNWGKCVDINAPGVDITSVGIWSDTQTMSGTSMAAPHVTGLLSYFLSLQPATDSEFSTGSLVTPEEMKKRLIKFGTRDVLSGLKPDTVNILAFNGGLNPEKLWA